MSSFTVLGTDTDAGKTTFCLLWLAAFADRCAYWKPVETGISDSAQVKGLVRGAKVFPPLLSLAEPVAPLLAARRQHKVIPPVAEILACLPRPTDRCFLLLETFGSPWSPLDETHLQIDLIRHLPFPCVLVSSTRLGAIGRTLQCLIALGKEGVVPRAVVLLGPEGSFAMEQLTRRQPVPVIPLLPPAAWTEEGVLQAADSQKVSLQKIADLLDTSSCSPGPVVDLSADWQARDRRTLWHPYTSLRAPSPPVCIGAADEFLILEDGRRLVDAISSWWTILHGHRDPDLMRAWHRASGQIDHVLFAGLTHPWGIQLAELLLSSAGLEEGRVFYSDNGSTAVEVALKMAYQYWHLQGQSRNRFVGFQHGYHGDTFGAMAISRDPVFFGRFEPLLFQADILALDPGSLDQHLGLVGKDVSAVIVEPLVQGAGGMRMHSPQVLADLFAVTRKHGVLFIADEVMTGGGRTGSLWAFQQAGIRPDLVCSAKTLAGGLLPLAATLVEGGVVAPFDSEDRTHTFFHGHSFTGHPLACAVALASRHKLNQWDGASASHPARRIEAFWRDALDRLKGKPRVREVRIQGTIAALELDAAGGYLSEAGRLLPALAQERGVFLRPLGNVLYAMPPFCISQESLEKIVQVMEAAAS